MKKFLNTFAIMFFGSGPAGQPQTYEEQERERQYKTWELVIIYTLMIGMAIKLYLTYQP